MQVYENCPHTHGDKKGCPYYYEVFGKCFSHCDCGGEFKCGNCAHWYGHETASGARHDSFGSCFYCIGNVNAGFKVSYKSCEHYTERKPNELCCADWIEKRVLELGGKPDSSPESRKLRMQAREEWIKSHN